METRNPEVQFVVDEIAKVTDRETFNSLMKNFDQSFINKYIAQGPRDASFPFGGAFGAHSAQTTQMN